MHDVGLNLIHRFRPKGEFLNQENYFPLNGWSEASCQWKIPIFGTSIFFRRSIPSDWPTGIIWNGGEVWKKPRYHDITIPHDSTDNNNTIDRGTAEVRIFTRYSWENSINETGSFREQEEKYYSGTRSDFLC